MLNPDVDPESFLPRLASVVNGDEGEYEQRTLKLAEQGNEKKGYVMLLNMVVKKKINYGCVSLINLVMKKKEIRFLNVQGTCTW